MLLKSPWWGLSKNIWHAFVFGHHWTVRVCQMLIELFRLRSNTLAIGCRLKFFSCPRRHGLGMIFFQKWYYMHPLFLATEKFQSPSNIPPPSNGDRNFLITKRDRAYAIILQKTKNHPLLSFLGNWKNLVAIRWCGCVKWRPKFFSCHPTHLHYLTPAENFSVAKKLGGMSHVFGKPLRRPFQKDPTSQPFVVTFFSEMKMGLHAPPTFGNQKNSVTIRHTCIIGWQQIFHQKGWDLCYIFGRKKNHPSFPLGWSKKFGHHLTMGVCQMATKIFPLPKRGGACKIIF